MNETPLFSIIDPDGRHVSAENLPLDALSLARGVFETMLVIDGRPLFAERHADRLAASCVELAVAGDTQARSLLAAASGLASGIGGRVRLRLAVYGAAGAAQPVGLVAVRPAGAAPECVDLAWAGWPRASSPLARHKTVNYLEHSLAREEARSAGFYDALWRDCQDSVTETTTANIFFHYDGRLVTAAAGVLPGIVRRWVLEEAAAAGIEAIERRIDDDTVERAASAFITNSIIGIVPVGRISSKVLADPRGEAWFSQLREAYERAVGGM